MKLETDIASIKSDVKNLVKTVDELKVQNSKEHEEIKGKYVTKSEFNPVKRIVYGMVALVLTGVFAAMVSGVIK